MKLKFVAAAALMAVASSGSMAFTSSTFGGQHDPVENALGFYLGATTFVDIFSFSLGVASTVSSTSTALGALSFGSYALWGAGPDTVAGTFDDWVVGAAGLGAPGTLSFAVVAGSYYYKATGIVSAPGAAYSLASTITPVPEPETYAMMLAGLGALGFLARRRRNV